MRQQDDTPEHAIAALAARQHGVVSYKQLLAAGLSGGGIARRVRAGRLHRVHRGVYAVGHLRLSQEGRWMAAVLACGPRTALSHRSAAALWRMLPPESGPVEVTISGSAGRKSRARIRLHRSRTLGGETTRRYGIPATKPGRTLTDLAVVASQRTVRRAARQAEVLGLFTGMDSLTERTRSDLELAFLRLCRRHRLPAPEVNVRIGSIEVDFFWREQRLIVETDGYRYHRGRAAFEDDRRRDLRLRTCGYSVIRLAEGQMTEEPARIAEAVKEALLRSGRSG